MLTRWQFNILLAIGVVALALVIGNGVMFMQNRGAQTEISARQQYLQQTVGLEGLYRDIVKALAELAVKNNDPQLLQMLAAQGINVSVTPPAPVSNASPQAAAPKR
jgi:hypothetical protein